MKRKIFIKTMAAFLFVLLLGTLTLDVTLRILLDRSLFAQAGPVVHRSLVFASIFSIAVAALLAAVFANVVATRISRILSFANRVTAGDLSARMGESHSDELEEVAIALNATASKLEQSFRSLEAHRRELTALLDSMQEAVIAVDAEGRVQWSNALMQRYAEGRIRAGVPLVHSVRDPEVLEFVQSVLASGTVHRGRSTSMAHGRILEVSASPMPGGGAVAVFHDVTEVDRVDRTRRDFIANVSHELRTPLTSIMGYVETLLEGREMSEESRDFLAIILKNARRMNRLTEDLLALARVESGEHKLRLAAVPASEILVDARDSLEGLVEAHAVLLEIRGTTDCKVLADRDGIQQILANLIENAAKYASSGGRIELAANELPEEGAVEFSVRDFGPGIRSEHLDRIFERFYRVDKARSLESGGTGLGLAIAKHVTLAHRGQIRAESDLNRGCTFYFTLPMAIPAALRIEPESEIPVIEDNLLRQD